MAASLIIIEALLPIDAMLASFGKQVLIEYTRLLDDSGDSNESMVFEAVVQAAEVLGWQRRRAVSKVAAQGATEGT